MRREGFVSHLKKDIPILGKENREVMGPRVDPTQSTSYILRRQ